MNTGQHKDYFWVQWENAFIDKLLERAPDIVLGKYLINTSFDSGSLTLSEDEQTQGWRSTGAFAYSPLITDVSSVPHYFFEEWLAFESQMEVATWSPVINYCGFTLVEPPDEFRPAQLWSQLETVRPESYLGRGDRWLIFVTRNKSLFDQATAQTGLEIQIV
jgi:hypothetical protein